MNKVKLKELIKKNDYKVPYFILEHYQEFNLTLDEFVLLIYLFNNDNIIYDPELISNTLNIPLENVLIGIESLSDKGLISLDSVTNSSGLLEEKINIDSLYEKITLSIINELSEEEKSDKNIFKEIEDEFNRKLKPMEQEMVIAWQKEYSDELIREALKEASIDGSTNLRYLDKVLYDWKKQGIKNVSEINKLKEISKEPPEVYIGNWLDDDGEI